MEEEALASIACHKNQALSSAERRDIAVRAAKTRWTRLNDPSQLSTASHRGSLQLGEIAVDVYRLQDGRRFISKKGMADVRATLGAEGYDSILVRRLEGDSYFKFRLGQRMRAAQREPNGC